MLLMHADLSHVGCKTQERARDANTRRDDMHALETCADDDDDDHDDHDDHDDDDRICTHRCKTCTLYV